MSQNYNNKEKEIKAKTHNKCWECFETKIKPDGRSEEYGRYLKQNNNNQNKEKDSWERERESERICLHCYDFEHPRSKRENEKTRKRRSLSRGTFVLLSKIRYPKDFNPEFWRCYCCCLLLFLEREKSSKKHQNNENNK